MLCLQRRLAVNWQKKAHDAGSANLSRLGDRNYDCDDVEMGSNDEEQITILGRTNFRGGRKLFGLKRADRRAHVYIIGKTGTGKSTLLETMIRQDMEAGDGLALLDPHGDLVEKIVNSVPEARKNDLIYLNAPDLNQRYGFNPVGNVASSKRPLAASGLIEVFKKIWADSWGPRMEYILRNIFLTLLDKKDSTLADIPQLLTDKSFRRTALFWSRNEEVKHFWLKEYESYPARLRAEAIAPIQNKVGAFLTNPIIKKLLTRPEQSLRIREIMDGGTIFLVNIAKGKIGEDVTALLGALIVSRTSLAGLSRANLPDEQRRDFYVYLDEFQTFTTLGLANMLSELRKYRVNLVLAHQFISQIDTYLRGAILGNVGTIISFRLGADDAELMEREFEPDVKAADLTSLPNFNVYVKLMVDGQMSEVFSGETISTLER